MHATVCICTRARGDSVVRTIRSIMRSRYDDFDVIIVDQSNDDATALAAHHEANDDSRLTYIRSQTTGLSRARNICVQHARGPVILFTDDDCEVTEDWLERIVGNFLEYPDVGQINGGVVHAGSFDATQGFIPTYDVHVQTRINSPWQKWREGGIGANMAFRLDALRRAGPFDEVLGAGGPLHTCEDGDMTYRILRVGYSVLNVTDAPVLHYGFRTWQQGKVMMHHTGLGVAAAYMKHLRLRDIAVLPTLLVEWMRCISWRRLLLLRRHSGLRRFLGYAQGLVLSFRYPIDPQWRTYQFEHKPDPRRGLQLQRQLTMKRDATGDAGTC